jgi:hypothetical protein
MRNNLMKTGQFASGEKSANRGCGGVSYAPATAWPSPPTSRVARSGLAFDQPAATLFPLMAFEATYVFPTTTQEMSR